MPWDAWAAVGPRQHLWEHRRAQPHRERTNDTDQPPAPETPNASHQRCSDTAPGKGTRAGAPRLVLIPGGPGDQSQASFGYWDPWHKAWPTQTRPLDSTAPGDE